MRRPAPRASPAPVAGRCGSLRRALRACPAVDSTPKPPFRWRRAAVRLGVSAALLAVLAWALDERALAATLGAFWRDSPLQWLAAVGLFLALHALGALKWRFFLGLAGARLSVRQAVRFYAAGLFANLCLPSLIGGDVLRAGLAVTAVESKEAVVLGSVVDRLADLAALGLLVAGAALFAPGAVGVLEGSSIRGPRLVLVFFLVLVAGAAALLTAVRLLARARPGGRLSKHVRSLRAGLQALRANPGSAALGLAICLALQAGFVGTVALLGQAMGFALDLRLWFLLWPLAKIAALLPVSLGGLGVRETAFALLVQPFGADAVQAGAVALIWDTVILAGGLAAGLYWLGARDPGESLRAAVPEDGA